MTFHITISRSIARFVLVAVAFALGVVALVAQTQVNRFPGKVIIESTAIDALQLAGTAQIAGNVSMLSTAPQIIVNESDGGADQKYYRFLADANAFSLQLLTDAFGSPANVFSVTRSGAVPSAVTFTPPLSVTRVGVAESASDASPAIDDVSDTDTGVTFDATTMSFIRNSSRFYQYTYATGVHELSGAVRALGSSPWRLASVNQATLAGIAAANGDLIYCTDCTIANPCAGGGSGALAKRINGAWICN